MNELLQNNLIEIMGPARVFAVSSGKGGVGKTTVVANLAAALTFAGKRVTVVDGDLGLANLDLLLGVSPQYTLGDFFAGRRALTDIFVTSPLGITVLPAASGAPEVVRLNYEQKLLLLSELDNLPSDSDIMLVDTASGISDIVTYFASAAHEIVLIVTPEPTSLADAYALVKVLAAVHGEKRFQVVANMVEDETEAQRLVAVLWQTASRSLHTSFELLGWIPRDPALTRAVLQQRLVVETAPDSPSARAFTVLARHLIDSITKITHVKGGLQFFFRGVLAASLEEKR
jgi:flagellar biosynthesis protein FlhG